MGWFDYLRQRPQQSLAPPKITVPSKRAPELYEAWRAFEEDRNDEAVELASRYVNHASPDVALDATKIHALALFRRREYAAAEKTFRHIAEARGEANDWFNLVTSSVLAGDLEIGATAYERFLATRSAGDNSGPTIPMGTLYYAYALRDCGDCERALHPLAYLRSMYESLRITDDHFLYIRGVPFLSVTLSLAVELFQRLNDRDGGIAWLDSFATSLDEDGQRQIENAKTKLTARA